MTHHEVQDVAVVGVPHRRRGEAVAAAVRLNDGAEQREGMVETLSRLISKSLADFKCPEHWIFADTLVRYAARKLEHQTVRKAAM